MTEKLTQAAARYVAKSPHANERCVLCSMFRKPFGCTDVKGHINPKGWCELFDRKAAEYAAGGPVMSDEDVGLGSSAPEVMSDADVGLAAPAPAAPEVTWDPRTWKPAEGPGAFILDVPREAGVATVDAVSGTAEGLNPLSQEHAVQPWDPSKGVGENLADQAGRQWERVKSAGSGLASAVSVPFAPFVGAARSLAGHPLASAVSASRRALGEPEKSPAETYEEAKQGVDTAMMALGPRGRAVAPVPVPGRPAPSGPLGVTLSRGQETGELALIQREQAALRGQEGAPAQRRAQEFADQQREQVAQAHEDVSRALDPVHGPDTVVYGSRYGQVIAETPQEAGALVSEGVRGAAAQRKAGVTEAYDIAKAQPGEVHAAAFEGIGQKIKGELSLRDDPIIIDDRLTPFASRAIQDVENRIANLRIQNRADPFGEPNPENIVGVSLRGVDQMRRRLSSFRNDAYASGNAADGRAAKAVIDAFDNEVDRAINSGLFSGNRSAVQAWNDARAAHADYRRTFSGSKNDAAGRVVEKVVGKGDNPAAIPNDVADFLYGSSGVNPGSLNVAVANRIKGILGEQSPEWTAVKQGLFARLSATGEGMRDMGPGKVAERLHRFLNVDGRELAHALYSPAEIDLMRQYANLMRRIEVPQAGANWSNSATFVQKTLNHIGSKIGMVIGAAVGHLVAPGMPWGISEAVGAGVAKGVGKVGERSQMRVVAKQMPLVADQIRQWQKAVRAANRANSPYSQRALSLATANLAQSLERIGVRGQAPALQMPAPSRAEENEPSVPRPPGQQQNGGRVTEENQGFAHGGGANHSVAEDSEQGRFADGGQVLPRSRDVENIVQAGRLIAPDLTSYLADPEPTYESRLRAAGADITGRDAQLVPNAAGKVPGVEDPRATAAMGDVVNLATSAMPTGGGAKLAMAAAPMIRRGMLTAGREALETAAPKGIRAYHGSPHDFERFDLSRIGTGEGAQAYGHGLYFAEKEGVAKAYRDTLSRGDKQWFVDDEVVGTYGQNSGALGGAAGRLRQVMGRDGVATEADATAALKALEQVNKNNPGMIPKAHFDEVSRTIPQLVGRKVAESAPGKMYEVNINARPEQFLDWDKPVHAQGPQVQGAWEKLTGGDVEAWMRPGEDLYRQITPGFVSSMPGYREPLHAKASEALREAGIPGIKYLDQGSRFQPQQVEHLKSQIAQLEAMPQSEATAKALAGRKDELAALQPTSNYVLFRDDIIDVLRKYGIVGIPAAGIAASVADQARGFADGGAVDRLPDDYASQNIEDRRSENTVRGRRLQAIQEQADAADTRQLLRSMKRVASAGGKHFADGGRVDVNNIDHQPTDAQKEAGNYKKDHVRVHGLDITIENAKGAKRSGVDRNGKPWSVTMPASYGYFKRTEGKDGDHVDCYLGPHLKAPKVWIIDQVDAESGKFDEHKCMLGFASKAQTIQIYKKGFSDGRGADRLGHVTEMPIEDFKHWLGNGNTKKPAVEHREAA